MAALSDGSIQALVLTKAALLKLTNDICNITVLPDEFDLVRCAVLRLCAVLMLAGRSGQQRGCQHMTCESAASPTSARPPNIVLRRSIKPLFSQRASPTGPCTTESTSS